MAICPGELVSVKMERWERVEYGQLDEYIRPPDIRIDLPRFNGEIKRMLRPALRIAWLLVLPSLAMAQDPSPDKGLPFIKHYTPKEYGAHSQNWAVVTDPRGVLYAGNTQGGLGIRRRIMETHTRFQRFNRAIARLGQSWPDVRGGPGRNGVSCSRFHRKSSVSFTSIQSERSGPNLHRCVDNRFHSGGCFLRFLHAHVPVGRPTDARVEIQDTISTSQLG